jgi:hypothetical protein
MAAFAVMREGRNPTVNAVRERMGGGSPNVVAPALQRWRHAFAGRLSDNAASAAEVLPPGIQELVEALWSRALFEAHRVAAETQTAGGAIDEMGAALKALKAATARIERREAELEVLIASRSRRPPAALLGNKPRKTRSPAKISDSSKARPKGKRVSRRPARQKRRK